MSNPILFLNQPYVLNGLGTVTYTAAASGSYSVLFSVIAPQALATGSNAGSGQGLGAGTGGGGEGFTAGDLGLGNGGVGQGFGAGNGYQQPPAAGSNQTSGSAVSSGLSVLVKVNGSTKYTMPSLAASQSAAQFKAPLSLAANDVVTVVLSSSGFSDNALNGLVSQIAINQGF